MEFLEHVRLTLSACDTPCTDTTDPHQHPDVSMLNRPPHDTCSIFMLRMQYWTVEIPVANMGRQSHKTLITEDARRRTGRSHAAGSA